MKMMLLRVTVSINRQKIVKMMLLTVTVSINRRKKLKKYVPKRKGASLEGRRMFKIVVIKELQKLEACRRILRKKGDSQVIQVQKRMKR